VKNLWIGRIVMWVLLLAVLFAVFTWVLHRPQLGYIAMVLFIVLVLFGSYRADKKLKKQPPK
jgi:hypothetical protein